MGALASPGFAAPSGLWLAKDGAEVRITTCGTGLCGVMAKAKSPTDPETGAAWTDKHNSDPAKRSRPLAGVPILTEMKQHSPREWHGRLYNVDDGQTCDGKLIEIDAKTIRVEGCALGMCGGENMTRIR